MSVILKKISKFKNMSFNKRLILIMSAFITLLVLFTVFFWTIRICRVYYDKNALKNLDISNVDKLMIVAHPDDETIWGGGHLIDGGYLVVCFTDSHKRIRKDEFIYAVKKLNKTNIPIILDFPDKTFGKRDNWFGIKNKIIKTVDNLLEMKDWNLVVTHNNDGEYGHIQHKEISNIVNMEYEKLGKNNSLYFFGKYHSKKKLPKYEKQMTPMDNELYNKKIEILRYFKSQKKVIDNLFHIFKYENWIQYNG